MKLTILLTLLSILKLSASGFAQQISIHAVDSPLIKVMQSVQKQSGIPFLLNGKEIADTKITVQLNEVRLDEALATIFKGKPIAWELSDGTIILRRAHIKSPAPTVVKSKTVMQRIVRGVITDEQGKPIEGASITVQNTKSGTTSDSNGNFSINIVPDNTILTISSVGFISQNVSIDPSNSLRITLKRSLGDLEEVVVIGYGTQKKKLTTGATVQVKGENLEKLSTPNILEALQSQSPGVQITQSSGMPGENFKVNIRGIGTIHDASPLYVIDGISGGDINMLNPSDIESVDILKDAASAAIYGARAANGVVLVTTKQGKQGKTTLQVDNYIGFQNAYKLPSLLNAREYMAIQDERMFNEGSSPYDWASEIPNQYQQIIDGTWQGTNWFKEAYNDNALLQNTSINLIGGSDISKFSLGYSISNREGIIGKPVAPDFQRHTARINSEHVLLKNDRFNVVKIGENISYGYNNKSGIGIGNIYWNDVHNLLIGNPLLPVYNDNGGYYDHSSKVSDQWNFDGATANPIAEMDYRRGQNLSKTHSLFANAYVEIQPIEDLVFRSNFGYRLSASSYRQYTPTYELSTTLANAVDDISQNQGIGYSWVLENTLSYKLQPITGHQLDMVIGQSTEKSGLGEDLSVTTSNSIFPGDWSKAWVTNGQGYEGFIPSVGGVHWPIGSIASFFGRANYNIDETYLASFTIRADGSSNFASGNRWGYFPSGSLGWIITNEDFLRNNNWVNFLKWRVSWGQNGNANIDPFMYLSTVSTNNQNGYYFGNNMSSLNRGAYPDILPNPDVSWETSEQLNFGFDARFVANKLSATFDWYKKTTKDWLVRAPVLAIYGTDAPFINGGDVENKGIEVGLNWSDTKGDFRYTIGINGAYNKNKVLRIANGEGIIHGDRDVLSQGTTEMYRAQVGYPIGYFYGYKTDGIFQNQQQIEDLRSRGIGVLPTAQPGDIIFSDTNGDGSITDDDKINIGNPHPDFSGGLNLSVGYKGIDLAVTAIGSFGHQIAKSYRSFADSPLQNYTTEIFQRWHGEGTSNKYPRLTNGSHTNTQYISDIYIENGDFVKIQNITIGYDLNSLWKKSPLGQIRLYATVQNLHTFTKYSGLDPEIGYGNTQSWVGGIDLGFYPQPRTVLFGLNFKF
ncbi:TonB-dependent receptor [Sphingobacterium shayense]|uniref:TonB-dependent receptor n=1 Tax=Sphingobacterium shayense TaxID=626343 RepID=UPI001FEB2962|nr:TonB-dependent receptor [Sphingobacterium shayense]